MIEANQSGNLSMLIVDRNFCCQKPSTASPAVRKFLFMVKNWDAGLNNGQILRISAVSVFIREYIQVGFSD